MKDFFTHRQLCVSSRTCMCVALDCMSPDTKVTNILLSPYYKVVLYTQCINNFVKYLLVL